MEENLNIFGKNQGEIGSLDKNLVLRTKGRVYIRYGRKYIELLDDKGNINVKIPKVLTKVDSIDKIKDTGFYLLNGNLYACYEGDVFQITGVEGEYISYSIDQNLTQEQISTAQKNIGLTFPSINDATKSINKGIVFVGDKIYYIENGNATEIFGLNHPLKEINSAKLSEVPQRNNSAIIWHNGDWIYEEIVLKSELNNSGSNVNLNTPIKDINNAKLGYPKDFTVYEGTLIPKAIVAIKENDGKIKWIYEDVVPFSSFKDCCEKMKEQIAYIKDLIYNNNSTKYGGTDNWGKDRAPLYIEYPAGSQSKNDSIYVNNITLQEYAGDGNWCKCVQDSPETLHYVAVTENTGPESRTAYFTHKTTDTILARGHHAGGRVLSEWPVTVIQLPKNVDTPVNKKLLLGRNEETVNSQAQSIEVKLITNVEWKVISDSSWCTASPMEGNGISQNDTVIVTVSVTANESSRLRQAILTFSNPTGNVSGTKLLVRQEAGKLINLGPTEFGFTSNTGKIIKRDGQSDEFQIPVLYDKYYLQTTEPDKITWSSSNSSIASVNNSGQVTANADSGTCQIYVNYAGDEKYNPKEIYYTLTIEKISPTVEPKDLTNDEFKYSQSSITVTDVSQTLPTFINTQNVSPITYTSSNTSVATVNSSGTVIPTGTNGTTIIKATFAGNSSYNAKTAQYTLTVNIQEEEETELDRFLNVYNTGFFNSYNEPITKTSENYEFLTEAADYFNTQYNTINWQNILKDPELGFSSQYEITSIDKDSCFGWFLGYLLLSLYPKDINGNLSNGILKTAFNNYSEVYLGCNYSNISLESYLTKYGSAIFASIIFTKLIRDKREEFKAVKTINYSDKFVEYFTYKNTTSDKNFYMDDRPEGREFFAKPPVNGSSNVIYNRDTYAHDQAGKLRGTTDRGLTGYNYITLDTDYMLSIYNAATGQSISSSDAYKYQTFNRTINTGSTVVNSIKEVVDTTSSWYRVRPVDYLSTEHDGGTTYSTGGYNNGNYYYDNLTKKGVSGTTSYPSGHTGKAWNFAFIYALESPNLSNSNFENLFKRAFKYCESRVVVGAHWQYCVDMGRIAASCAFAYLCGNNEFISRLDKDLLYN